MNYIAQGMTMQIEVMLWILSGSVGVISILVATLWQMTRAEQKAQDEAIKAKADKTIVEDSGKRFEKEIERIRHDNEKVVEKIEARHEKDLEAMENRLCTKIESMESNVLRQIELIMELLKKDR